MLAMAASVGQAVVGFAGAQADYSAKAQAWTQNYTNALASGRDEMQAYTLRELQEGDAYEQKDNDAAVDAAKKASTVAVSAASAGLSGVSVDSLVADVQRQGLRNRSTLKQNYQMTVQQLSTEDNAVTDKEQSEINSMQRPTAPSPLSYMVDALSGIVKASG